ncbi:hypothetical protein RHGRI_012288 [Rhododendron griersonianum]|uniref:Uncharacterized protein n=1 Tax=Rhododendron griersonianum TaxID=479676 RepID=A0AAV6KPY7_9ERIC|nr:hypothetical protein RHGRI_012288 [Rhododendron griersonianum]
MTFRKVMAIDHPGDYRGSLRLSLPPRSLLVMPAPINPPMSFTAPVALPPVSSGWPVVPPPRHPPVPGTGVFLPPPHTWFGSSVSPKGQVDGKMPRKECNGSVDGIGGADMKAADKPGGTV